jgi:hypothetical protein
LRYSNSSDHEPIGTAVDFRHRYHQDIARATEVSNGGLEPGDTPQMFDRLVQAHRGAYALIHRYDPGAQVTSNAAYVPGAQPHLDAWFLDRVRDTLDYVGVDYYFGITPDNLTAAHAVLGDFASIVPHPHGNVRRVDGLHAPLPGAAAVRRRERYAHRRCRAPRRRVDPITACAPMRT